MITKNEKKVLRLILTAFGSDYSINNVAKECGLTPNGAYKILKKFENEGILRYKKIANIKSYKINFDNEKTTKILELILIPDIEGRIEYRTKDLESLRKITKACILFGSYITAKKEPNDLDILFVFERANYKEYKKRLAGIKEITPVKIHDIIQTEEDLATNIREKNKAVLNALKNGIVLWGQEMMIRVIKNV